MIPLHYDLHIHSCLSPCGDNESTPGNIVGMAVVKGLDVIALTDHNTCKNCAAAMAIGKEYGITVIPGMELTTSEEVHVLCLFHTLEDAMGFDAFVEPRILHTALRRISRSSTMAMPLASRPRSEVLICYWLKE